MFVLNQINQEAQARFGTGVVHAHVFHVILAVGKFKRVSAISGDQRPGEVRLLQVEHQRALAFRLQLFIQRRDLFPGFRRVRYQVFVIDQRQGFNGDRIGDQLAVIAHRVPGEREKLVLEGFVGGDFRQQARLGIATKTVMRPEDNIRAVTGRRHLRVLLFQLVRMLNGDLNPGIFLEFLADFREAVIAFVAVDPDHQLAFFNFGKGRGGKHHRRQRGERKDASASFHVHKSRPLGSDKLTPLSLPV